MTARKPANVPVHDWVERQIRSAESAGAFENLPGAGKPIRDIDLPQHELAWLADYLRREDADPAAVLPPALAMAKEVELLPQRLLKQRQQSRVEAVVADLNERIDRAHAAPQLGPPFRVKRVDAEKVIADWARARAALAAARPVATPAVPAPPRRSWWGLRRRSAAHPSP